MAGGERREDGSSDDYLIQYATGMVEHSIGRIILYMGGKDLQGDPISVQKAE